MKKAIVFLTFLGCLFFAENLQAQDFKSAIGLRLGYPLSISYKHFLNEADAIEIYAGTRGYDVGFGYNYRFYSISGAYQRHTPIESVDGLSYYYGAGASIYFWTFGDLDPDDASTAFGLQGYGGLSYTFENKPINISLDWVPTFFLNGYGSGFGAGYGSLAVRYIFAGRD
ncbi:MAG: hypothetical protein ACI85O_001016 [Saprospiraceae bacterium]|jgi:hypothetical protein